MKNIFSKFIDKNDFLPLTVLLLIGFLLRITSLFYGLPLQLSIDEPALVSGVISLKDGLNIGRFDWPHLYFYINFIFYGFGFVLKTLGLLPEFLGEIGIYFVISRLVTTTFGVMTILLVYMLTTKIYQNRYIALLAAIFVTFLPVHVLESRFAKLDVALTFFITLVLWYIYNLYKKPSAQNFIIVGFLIGIAMSIKYNAFLIYLSLFLAFLNIAGLRRSALNYKTYLKFLYAGFATIVGFLIGTPYALLDFEDFWSDKPQVGLLWQFQNVGNVPWQEYSVHIFNTFFNMYLIDLGIGIWLLFMALIVVYLFFNRRNPIYNFTLLPTIIISFYISKLDRSPSHYFLFLMPLYIIPLAHFTYDLLAKIKATLKLRFVAPLILTGILMPAIFITFYDSIVYLRQDTRLMAYNWFRTNIEINRYDVYVAGEELSTVVFQQKRSDKIKRIDPDVFDKPLPVILIMADPNLSYEYLKSVNWDPPQFGGSSERVLPAAELLFEASNINRKGPGILIFKINELNIPKDDTND